MSAQQDEIGEESVSEVGDRRPSGEGPLSTDAIFETLSSRRRRYILHYLKQRDESVTIRDLSTRVAAWENGVEVSAVTPKERKRVYTALHQTHLPKMDKLGVVVHDPDRGVVELTPHVRAFDIYLDIVDSDDIPWSHLYLAVGAVLTTLTVVAALGIYPFSLVPGLGYALLLALTFTAVAAYHTYRERQHRVGVAVPKDEVVPPLESRATGSLSDDD